MVIFRSIFFSIFLSFNTRLTHLSASKSNLLNFDSLNRFLPIASQSWCGGVSKLATFIPKYINRAALYVVRWLRSGHLLSGGWLGLGVRVLGYGFGVRGRKFKSRDCALASDLLTFSKSLIKQ